MLDNVLICERNGTTVITPQTKLNLGDCFKILDKLAQTYAFDKRLWDLRGTTVRWQRVEYNTLLAYAAKIFDKPTRTAILVAEGEDELLHNLNMAINAFPPENIVATVFTDFDEAMAWLQEPVHQPSAQLAFA